MDVYEIASYRDGFVITEEIVDPSKTDESNRNENLVDEQEVNGPILVVEEYVGVNKGETASNGKILNLCDTIYELSDEYMAQNNCSFSLPEIRSKLAKILNENYPPLASTSENKKSRKSIFQSFVGWLRSLRVLQ